MNGPGSPIRASMRRQFVMTVSSCAQVVLASGADSVTMRAPASLMAAISPGLEWMWRSRLMMMSSSLVTMGIQTGSLVDTEVTEHGGRTRE